MEEHYVRWMDIEGFPKYSINNFGDVWSEFTGRLLAIRVNQYGVPFVGLTQGHRQYQRSLALLVAQAFIPNSSEIWDTPINLDGDRFNCVIENLMWRPRWFAIRYNQQFKHPYERPINAPLRAFGSDEVYEDSFDAAKAYGLLERDVVLSVENSTLTWPTDQRWILLDV